MKCWEVNKLLVSYLDGEVTPSESTLIKIHLDKCESCQKELAALSETKDCVSVFLHTKAAQASPSAQVWSFIQARVAKQAQPVRLRSQIWFRRLTSMFNYINPISGGGLKMKKVFVLTAVVAILLGACGMAFVPSIRSQVGATLKSISTWFGIKSLSGDYEMTFSGPMDFTPLRPAYLTPGLQSAGGGIMIKDTEGESVSCELSYHNKDEFITFTQTRRTGNESLPRGRKVTIGGLPAVLITGIEGTFEYGFKIPKDAYVETYSETPPVESSPSHGNIPYIDGKQLTWYIDEIKVELLSNLSEEEILSVAESLEPVETGQGDPPFQPPLDIPSEGEERTEKTIQVDGGVIKWTTIESKPQ